MTISNTTLRLATLEDVEHLRSIRHRAIMTLAGSVLGEDIATDWANEVDKDRFSKAITTNTTWLALFASSPAGWIEIASSRIEGLYVDPDHALRGVGARLVRHALRQMASDGHRRATLDASTNAVAFYERMGFEKVAHAVRGNVVPMQRNALGGCR